MSYRFLMVINNKQGNGKKVGWVFTLMLRENKREAANDKHMVQQTNLKNNSLCIHKGTKKETFSLIKLYIDFSGGLINLLCNWATAVTGG